MCFWSGVKVFFCFWTVVCFDSFSDALSEDECRKLSKWLKRQFPKKLEKVEMTLRLKTHPAVLVDHQSQAIRHYLQSLGEDVKTPPQRMQINPNHNVVKGLFKLIDNQDLQAQAVASQVCVCPFCSVLSWAVCGHCDTQLINNAFIAAGVMDDPRDMLQDMYNVMEMAMGYELDEARVKRGEKETPVEEEMQEMIAQERAKEEKEREVRESEEIPVTEAVQEAEVVVEPGRHQK